VLRTIVVVGGGFSGTVLTACLLRHPPAGLTRVVLIERARLPGRGVAYAAREHPYLLNVPVGRMSASSADPEEFLRHVRRRRPACEATEFVPRALYGEYLQDLLRAAQMQAPQRVRLEVIEGAATGVRRVTRASPLLVQLDDGGEIVADEVVLATGNPPPAHLPATRPLAGHERYIHDPWAGSLGFRAGERLLLIGTGLTALDVVLAAAAAVDRPSVVHCISRRGIIPPRQTAFRPDAFRGDGESVLLGAAPSLRRIVRAVRILAEEAERAGGDWREAITLVRNIAPTLWQRLPESERRRFLRHVRVYWDVHRHRLPESTVEQVERHRKSGWMHVHAGHIEQIDPGTDALTVRWRARHSGEPRSLGVDRVVNCTGPDYAPQRSDDPLLCGLLRDGLAVADPLGLGLRTGPHGALVDADGWPGPHLYYLGPMLRADHWETTAALELRGHAERLAAHLAGRS
jgi:uncharacterized NAD(P)/FAD-binding protein YdhS